MALFRKSSKTEPTIKRAGAKDYSKLTAAQRAITLYAEDGGSWPHLEPIISELTQRQGRTICYLTSDDNDPVFSRTVNGLLPFSIGDGVGRSFLFQMMETGVMLATVPQLGLKVLPRSRNAARLGTQYVYVFHSMASTHMIYEPDGFDHYDTVLVVGPYMEREIRARELQAQLPPKELIAHGYGRLDSIIAANAARVTPQSDAPAPTVVLIAPSWGPHCIFETCGNELVRVLLDAGFEVIARPHPMTAKRTPEALVRLESAFRDHPRFLLERDISSQESLHRCDVMVSDWSGAALEYAFGRERPVLFIDVPRKVNNPLYGELGIEPFEASIRSEIGAIVAPHALDKAAQIVNDLVANPHSFSAQIRQVRDANIHNVTTSAKIAADIIGAKADAYLARITA